MIKNNSQMLYTHKPLVKNRVGNDSFLSDGYFNRVKIDFNYLDIFEYLFTKDSVEYKSMRLLLDRERTLFHFLKSKYLVSINKEKKQDFDDFLKTMKIDNRCIISNMPNIVINILLRLYK